MVKQETKNHGNTSPTSSTPSSPDSVSLGEDNEAFIYENRPIDQKVTKEHLNIDKEKRKLGT